MSFSTGVNRRDGTRFHARTCQTKGTMCEETTRERDELDDVIDRCKMIERTGMTREELHKRVEKATYCLNIANCLSDVIETLVMDAESILWPFGATFERQDKMHFKQLIKSLQEARKCAGRCCIGLYEMIPEEFADDSDWWYNIIRLLADRIGNDELKTQQVLNWLDAMPSVMQMFNVKKRDFKKIQL